MQRLGGKEQLLGYVKGLYPELTVTTCMRAELHGERIVEMHMQRLGGKAQLLAQGCVIVDTLISLLPFTCAQSCTASASWRCTCSAWAARRSCWRRGA